MLISSCTVFWSFKLWFQRYSAVCVRVSKTAPYEPASAYYTQASIFFNGYLSGLPVIFNRKRKTDRLYLAVVPCVAGNQRPHFLAFVLCWCIFSGFCSQSAVESTKNRPMGYQFTKNQPMGCSHPLKIDQWDIRLH